MYIDPPLDQTFTAASLSLATRAATGTVLRRPAGLTQLAVVGALGILPPERRQWPTALLWQTMSGPRAATCALLEEICHGTAEPMPYDFLATQPALAAAQLQPFLPGLALGNCFPLADETGQWRIMLALADAWLREGRFAQVLCAHLDCWETEARGHWLSLTGTRLPSSMAALRLGGDPGSPRQWLADTHDLPVQLADQLNGMVAGDEIGVGAPAGEAGPVAVRLRRL